MTDCSDVANGALFVCVIIGVIGSVIGYLICKASMLAKIAKWDDDEESDGKR